MGQSAIILHAPSSGRERQRVLADLGPGSHRRLHGLTSGKAQLRNLPELAAHIFDTPQPMARRLRLLTHGLKIAHPLRGLSMSLHLLWMSDKTGTTRACRGLNPVSRELRSDRRGATYSRLRHDQCINLPHGGLHDVRIYCHILIMFRGRQRLCNPPCGGYPLDTLLTDGAWLFETALARIVQCGSNKILCTLYNPPCGWWLLFYRVAMCCV